MTFWIAVVLAMFAGASAGMFDAHGDSTYLCVAVVAGVMALVFGVRGGHE